MLRDDACGEPPCGPGASSKMEEEDLAPLPGAGPAAALTAAAPSPPAPPRARPPPPAIVCIDEGPVPARGDGEGDCASRMWLPAEIAPKPIVGMCTAGSGRKDCVMESATK